MDNPSFTETVESTLAGAGISVARLCRRADIAQSTWHRLRQGQCAPRQGTRDKVMSALRDLVPESGPNPPEAA